MQETLERSETHQPTARRNLLRVVALGVLGVAIVLAGVWAWWTLPKISKYAPDAPQQSAALPLPALTEEPFIPPPIANALAQTTTRLAALETELTQLKNAAMPVNSADADAVKQLDNAVRAVSNSLDAIHTAITAITARLAALEAIQAAQPLGGEAKRISFALALRELEHVLNGSGPFAMQLETIRKLLEPGVADGALEQLQAFASTGIATRATLSAQFDAVAAAVVRADSISGVPQGWAGRIYAFVQSLIMIRPLGERAGDDVPAIVARAQARLEAGDLDAAVTELNGLTGAAADAAAAWLKDARARLIAEQTLAHLSAALARQLDAQPASAVSTPPSLPDSAGE